MAENKAYRMGWDVGGWHCDKNRESRDALVVLEATANRVQLTGHPWRGNLRRLLCTCEGPDVLRAMLRLCQVTPPSEALELTIAIDTPLGWPRPMVELIAAGATTVLSDDDRKNPYTRRTTELDLIERGIGMPLSAVRDMIGSQSTKGVHFLGVAGLSSVSHGIWAGQRDGCKITAIETYPAAAAARIASTFQEIAAGLEETLARCASAKRTDIEDALRCAIVAHLFADKPDQIEPIPTKVPDREGWIVLPK